MSISRRSFLAGVGGLGVLTALPRSIIKAANSNAPDLLAFADMEVSTFADLENPPSQYLLPIRAQSASPLPAITTDFARNGSKSLRCTLNNPGVRSEWEPYGNTQADGIGRFLPPFEDHWMGFSIYIPSNWETNSAFSELIWQLPQQPGNNNWKSPCVAAYIDTTSRHGAPNNYELVVRYINDKPATEWPGNEGIRTLHRLSLASALNDRGKWTDWVIHYRPDWRKLTEGGNGLVQIWKDGTEVVNIAGPNFYWSDIGAYLKLGPYKWDWRYANNDPVRSRTYYYDELRLARPSLGDYSLVAPRSENSLAPPESPPTRVD